MKCIIILRQSLVMRMMRTSLPASSAESQKVGAAEDIGARSSTSTCRPDAPAVSYVSEAHANHRRTARSNEEVQGGRIADGRRYDGGTCNFGRSEENTDC